MYRLANLPLEIDELYINVKPRSLLTDKLFIHAPDVYLSVTHLTASYCYMYGIGLTIPYMGQRLFLCPLMLCT